MVLSTMRTTSNTNVDETEIVIFYSDDAGQSWQQSDFQPMTPPAFLSLRLGGGDPVLTFDAEGRVHLVWLLLEYVLPLDIEARVLHAISEDGGRSWTKSEQAVEKYVVGFSNPDNVDVADKPWVVADTNPASPYFGSVYAMHTQLAYESADSVPYQILIRRWTPDGGWADANVVAISSDQLLFCHFPHGAIDNNGAVHLLAAGASPADPYTAIYHTVSHDGGQSFTPPSRVSYFDLNCFLQDEQTPACVEGILPQRTTTSSYIYANTADDELYAIWHSSGFRSAVTEGVDVYFSRSRDGGVNWSEPQIVNQDSDPATDNFLPSGSLSMDGHLSINWYDQRSGTDSTYYYGRVYDPRRETFGPELTISTQTTNFGQVGGRNAGFGVGEYNSTISTENTIIPVWADGRTNDGDLNIYVARVAKESGTVTSIRQIKAQTLGLSIQSNPVSSVLRATLHLPPGPNSATVEVNVYDGAGRTVTGRLPAKLMGENEIEIPVAHYPPGVFYLHVSMNNGHYAMEKFIKK
jgi:hypothetical protein